MQELLQRDYQKRPRVDTLRPLFGSYLLLVDHSLSETFDLVSSIGEYALWKNVVHECQSQQEVIVQLVNTFIGHRVTQPFLIYILVGWLKLKLDCERGYL